MPLLCLFISCLRGRCYKIATTSEFYENAPSRLVVHSFAADERNELIVRFETAQLLN